MLIGSFVFWALLGKQSFLDKKKAEEYLRNRALLLQPQVMDWAADRWSGSDTPCSSFVEVEKADPLDFT